MHNFMEKLDYTYNPFGAKILIKHTKSFATYANENASMELFLIYILSANHPDKDDIKMNLAEIFSDDKNKYAEKFISAMKSDVGDKIFDPQNYEIYFGQMAYCRMADNALCYFKDILSEVVLKRPEIIKSSEKEPLDYILSFKDMESLLVALSEKKIKQLFYGKFIDIKKFFLDKLGIELFENQTIENNFVQFIKQRNIIVHNRGIINQEFIDEFKNCGFTLGHSLYFKYENLSIINKEISNIISEIDLKVRNKFDLEAISVL